jgi:hypothetical protein
MRQQKIALFEPLDRLEKLVAEHRQHLLQRKLHWLLHGWLLLHVPASVMLIVWIPVHVMFALRY